MNLHAIVAPYVSAVNPTLTVQVQLSTGPTQTQADGLRSPTFADPISVPAQIQALTFRDLQQLDGLNLQGERRGIYFYGSVDSLGRPDQLGGALVTFPDGSVWLVAIVLETYGNNAGPKTGWCKVAATRQNT